MRNRIVLGEAVETLKQFISYIEIEKKRSGDYEIHFETPAEVAAPFLRALTRREAQLLKEDAGLVTASTMEPRTPEQRKADAFVDVVMSVTAAKRYFSD